MVYCFVVTSFVMEQLTNKDFTSQSISHLVKKKQAYSFTRQVVEKCKGGAKKCYALKNYTVAVLPFHFLQMYKLRYSGKLKRVINLWFKLPDDSFIGALSRIQHFEISQFITVMSQIPVCASLRFEFILLCNTYPTSYQYNMVFKKSAHLVVKIVDFFY